MKPLILLAGLLALAATARAHDHIAAGASSKTPGSPLLFVGEDDFGADTGHVFPLTFATNGPYAGHHHGQLTVVALAATPDLGGPAPQAAALGAHIEAVIEVVEGPAGGSFGFWESPGDELDADTLTASFPVGLTGGSYRFPVSENDGAPGADPYGHIHGRVYSATLPGLYRVGFRFVDTAKNGADGGPAHAPSERFFLNFQAGLTIASITRTADGLHITFAAPVGAAYLVEAADHLAPPAVWRATGDPLAGDDHLRTVTLPVTGAAQFFRLRAE